MHARYFLKELTWNFFLYFSFLVAVQREWQRQHTINYFLNRAPRDRALMFDQKTRSLLIKAGGTEQTSKNSFHARD
jgi:hypothetical protein